MIDVHHEFADYAIFGFRFELSAASSESARGASSKFFSLMIY